MNMPSCAGVLVLSLFFASVSDIASARRQSALTEENSELKGFVERFGKELRHVRLDISDVTDRLRMVYSEYVSPELLASWIRDPSQAPGQVASSPWPDRIEIDSVSQSPSQTYEVTGRIIELTSWELTHGGVANEIPIRITVERRQGQFRIIQYRRTPK